MPLPLSLSIDESGRGEIVEMWLIKKGGPVHRLGTSETA